MKTRRLNARLDHLSRLELGEEPNSLEDHLLDVQLFAIQITDDYFMDIIEFFTKGIAPIEYSVKQKK